MIKISEAELQANLSDYLKQVSKGATISVEQNDIEVARLVPPPKSNWRDKMTIHARILVSPDELIKPIEDIWDDYI